MEAQPAEKLDSIGAKANLKTLRGPEILSRSKELQVKALAVPASEEAFRILNYERVLIQVKGHAQIRMQVSGQSFEDRTLREGETITLKARLPHRFVLLEDPGLTYIVEPKLLEDNMDGLSWYCSECGKELYSEFYHSEDTTQQILDVTSRFEEQPVSFTCPHCNHQRKSKPECTTTTI